MKTVLNAILAIIILSAAVFGLNKAGIITTNMNPSASGNTQEVIEGQIISDMPSEEDKTEDKTKNDTNNIPAKVEEKTNYISIPYPDTAEVGTFSELGSIDNKTIIYSYKVKLGGIVGGVENKRIEYSKSKGITGNINIVNASGASLDQGDRLEQNQVVYITFKASEVIQKRANTQSNSPTASNCKKYNVFFDCLLEKVSGVDPEIIRNNLNAYMDTISSLPSSEQDAKCANLIYSIKSRSENTAQNVCIEKLQ